MSGDHEIYGKNGQRPISIRSSDINHDTVKIVENAIGKRIYESAGKIRVSAGQRPLMVGFEGRLFAVVDERPGSILAQDLENGNKFWFPEKECSYFYEENLPEESMLTVTQVPDLETEGETVNQEEDPKTPEYIPPRPAPTPLTNQSDLAALIRLTQRRVESLNIEYEQAAARLELARQNRAATLTFLESLGINLPSAQPEPAPARNTFSIGGGSGRGGKTRTPQAKIDQIRMLTADGNKTAVEIAEITGISKGTVYNYQAQFRKEKQ